ncbi:MAG: hypothetical protein ABEJ26_04185 [Halosimplex sp.]
MEGNRLAVAAIVYALTAAVVVAVDPFRAVTGRNAAPLYYAYSALIGGNLNLLTIVVSVNQLVLTRELESPGKFERELDSIRELREDVGETIEEEYAPTTPEAFVRDLLDAVDEQADAVDRIARGASGDLTSDVGELVEGLRADLDRARGSLDERVPVVELIVALTRIDVTGAHRSACRLRDEYADELSADEREALSELARQVRLLVVTREHVQQLFSRKDLSNLSRVLLAVGTVVEALLLAALLAFVGLVGVGPFAPFSAPVVYASVAVGLVPLALVFAYVVRSATIAYRTASTTQFVVSSGRS